MDTRITSHVSVVAAIIAAVLSVLGPSASGATPSPGDFAEYPLPTANSRPTVIAAGPDGNLWFTEPYPANRIGRITPTGIITEYSLPAADSQPGAIAAGPDGNLWFTLRHGVVAGSPSVIGRITPDGAITEYPLTTPGSNPFWIAAGPDGAMWFTETIYRFAPGRGQAAAGSAIGRITTDGAITEYPLPTADGEPGEIAAGPDGNVWFTEMYGNKIGRITPKGMITEYSLLTPKSFPSGITAGPDGNLWFTEHLGERIGRITPSGIITEYPVPTHPSYPDGGYPSGITAGPDGNVWFTEVIGNKIGRITPGGLITEYRTPAGVISHPSGIVAGPDGNFWFTEVMGNAIGRISPTATPTVARTTCPLAVTLHGPIPRTVGNRILTDRITTKTSSCVLAKPLVRCQTAAGSTAGKTAPCDTKVTKRGQIRVGTPRGGSVGVTVSVRVKPQPGLAETWKSATWTGTWVLKAASAAKNKGATDLTLSEELVQDMDAAGVGIEAIRGATLSASGVVTLRVKSVKDDVITHKGGLQFSSSAGFVTLTDISLNYRTGTASASVETVALPTGLKITDVLTFTGGKKQIKQRGTWRGAMVALATSASVGDPAPLFAGQLGLPAGTIASGITIGTANITLER